MLNFLHDRVLDLVSVIRDVIPVAVVVIFFQLGILRRPIPNTKAIVVGFLAVIAGLYFFLIGLETAVFPIGESMAHRFSLPGNKIWALLFAFLMGYTTTIAEPALLAVARKAEELTAGGLKNFALRNAVATGVAIGLTMGVWRIFSGRPLWLYILAGYVITLILTYFAPRQIIPLAYDSGGVTTSTIMVPLVTALGLGLATNIPGRNPLIDGFGLIAFASVFPIISVLSYSIIIEIKKKNLRLRR